MSDKGRVAYEIDPHNRLIAKRSGKTSGVKGYRHVLDGRFKIDSKNTLTYHIKKSSNSYTPQQIKLSGNYLLDKDQNLVFTLNKWNNQIEGNRLVLKTEFLGAKDNELSFTVSTRDPIKKNRRIYTLILFGAWQADSSNRLSFSVANDQGSNDILTLKSAWKIGKNNEVIYAYGNRKKLTFKGYWDVSKKHQISYVLNKDIDSKFDFEVGLLKPTKTGLKYKISIGITPAEFYNISGSWKLLQTKHNTLTFGIKTFLRKEPQIRLALSRKILKDQGQAFIQAQKDGKELTMLTGIGIRW
ncbi:MAG: hypothetical protein ABIG92_02975 [Candidatus Omnitrophota bacterium]